MRTICKFPNDEFYHLNIIYHVVSTDDKTLKLNWRVISSTLVIWVRRCFDKLLQKLWFNQKVKDLNHCAIVSLVKSYIRILKIFLWKTENGVTTTKYAIANHIILFTIIGCFRNYSNHWDIRQSIRYWNLREIPLINYIGFIFGANQSQHVSLRNFIGKTFFQLRKIKLFFWCHILLVHLYYVVNQNISELIESK